MFSKKRNSLKGYIEDLTHVHVLLKLFNKLGKNVRLAKHFIAILQKKSLINSIIQEYKC